MATGAARSSTTTGATTRECAKAHPYALDILRGQYKDAASIYRSKEEDVLGKLHEKLQSERDKKTEKADQFAKHGKGVTAADMKPYLHVDHDAVLRETGSEMEQARGAQVDKKTTEQVARQDAERWYAANKGLVNAPPHLAIVAMTIDDLQIEAARLDELHGIERVALRRQSKPASGHGCVQRRKGASRCGPERRSDASRRPGPHRTEPPSFRSWPKSRR